MAMMLTHEWPLFICAGPEARLAFLQDGSAKLLTERTPDDEAGLVLRCEMAAVLLEQAELKEAKKIVEEIGEKLDAMFGCENRTYSTYHKTAALYHKAMGDAEAYYLAALQFLGYVDINDLPPAERHSWAFEIGTSLHHPLPFQPRHNNRRVILTHVCAVSVYQARRRCWVRRCSTSASCSCTLSSSRWRGRRRRGWWRCCRRSTAGMWGRTGA